MSLQWSPYNAYLWVIRSERGWYQVTKQYLDQFSGQMTWAIHACPLDSFGNPIFNWRKPTGMYVGGYTIGPTEDGQYMPDIEATDAAIIAYEESVPPTLPEATEAPAVPMQTIDHGSGI